MVWDVACRTLVVISQESSTLESTNNTNMNFLHRIRCACTLVFIISLKSSSAANIDSINRLTLVKDTGNEQMLQFGITF